MTPGPITFWCEWDHQDRVRGLAMTQASEHDVDAMLGYLVALGEAADTGAPPPVLDLEPKPFRDARRDRVREGNVILLRPRHTLGTR